MDFKEEEHTFKENDRVNVTAKSTSYKGRYAGKTGVVIKTYEHSHGRPGSIAVALDNEQNPASGYGYFYFIADELQTVSNKPATPSGYITCIDAKGSIGWADITLPLNMETCVSNILEKMNVNGENKNMKSEKILDLWKSNVHQSITDEFVAEEAKLFDTDPVCSEVRRHITEIDEMLENCNLKHKKLGNKTDYEGFICDTTKDMIGDAKEKMERKKGALNKLAQEVAAMLSACDTYEQEMGVLRTYHVIDEDGRLNKIFSL